MTIYVRELAAALAARGVHTDVFTRATSDFIRPVQLFAGVRVVPVEAGPHAPVPKELLHAHVGEFTAGVRAFATAQRITYGVVHSHYWQSGLAARDLARAWSVPFVHSNHTLALVKNRHLAPGDVPEPATRLDGERAVIDAADVLVTSTDEELEHLACLYGASHDRLKTIHPGVDHELFRPGDRAAARRALGVRDEAVVLYVGRIQRLKGLDLALSALARLRATTQPGAVLVVVGGASGSNGGDEVARLKALARSLGVADAVRFVGPRPHDELPCFYRAADVLAVCSHSESFGLAALEAHACGTPVVGTAVGGLQHVVRDGESGYLVATRDPDVFASRIAASVARADSFRNAAAVAARAFSWRRMADEFLELYDCLARERVPEACTC
ncbi:MAG TPA: glycosyltransferase [Actinomycetota bacterium]|nr:glycosyltransferase [Actinomycetota bacterium]